MRVRRPDAPRHTAGALAVLAAVCAGPSPVPVAAHPVTPSCALSAAPPVRILPLGDSITHGYEYGSYRAPLWNILVADGHAIDFVGSQSDGPDELPDRDHEGHRGWRTGQIEDRARGWVEDDDPDIVLLHIGTNDLIQGASAEETASSMDGLFDALTTAKPAMTVIVATLIPLHEGDERWRDTNDAIARLVAERAAAGHRFSLAAMADSGPQPGAEIPDGVHPNAEGYAAMAEVWYPAVSAAIADLTAAGR